MALYATTLPTPRFALVVRRQDIASYAPVISVMRVGHQEKKEGNHELHDGVESVLPVQEEEQLLWYVG